MCACSAPSPTPAGSSDGLVLVQIIGGSAELVRVRIADGATRQLTDSPGREESWPYWSPVVQRLVFQVRRTQHESDLVLWSEEHGETLLGATEQREERWPAWAPRTAKLVHAFRAEGGPSGLAVADFKTGTQQVVARAGDVDVYLRPSWAPTGNRIVAQRRLASGAGSRLWLISTDAAPKRLSDDPTWFEYKPHFTHDGLGIVFSRHRPGNTRHQIAHLNLASGERRRLAAAESASDHSARPSPTSDEVAFVSNRTGTPQIHRVDLSGGPAQLLTSVDGAAFGPRWSPDGQRIAMTVVPPSAPEPRLSDQQSLATARVVVVDREGNRLLDVPGVMPDWMQPWR